MNKSARKIQNLVYSKNYEEAYIVGRNSLRKEKNNAEIIESLKKVTAALRSLCMDMACKKQDNTPEYFKLEDLLRNVNQLTQQDMYGRQL